jgi:hypothetical protein
MTPVSYKYTILPMMAKSDEVNINPTEYLEMIQSLGEAGYELITIYNDCLIFKKACYNTEK